MKTKQKVILYVDDDPDDREFFCDAIRKRDPEIAVMLAENGLQALDCLSTMKTNDESLPSLIVLDINMPFLNGMETFYQIKKEEGLKHVPVIVFPQAKSQAIRQFLITWALSIFLNLLILNILIPLPDIW